MRNEALKLLHIRTQYIPIQWRSYEIEQNVTILDFIHVAVPLYIIFDIQTY